MFNALFAQNDLAFQWSVPIQSSSACRVFDIQTDGTYIYAVGDYNGTVNFDPNGGTATNLTSSAGLSQGFLAKYDQAGNLIWANETNWRFDQFFSSYSFKLSLNPAATMMVVSSASAANGNEFNTAIVYDASGNFIKELALVTSGNDPWDFKGACIDDQNAVYTYGSIPTGISNYIVQEYDATGNWVSGIAANAVSGAVDNLFIQKTDAANTQVFFNKYNNAGLAHGATIEDIRFQGGSLYMVGKHGLFIETDFFGIQIQNPVNTPSTFTEYGYLMKLNTSATPAWVKSVGSVQMNERLTSLFTDGTAIYTVGRSGSHNAPTSSGADFFIKVRAQNGAGASMGAYYKANKTFVQRWDMNGTVNWGKVYHGDQTSYAAYGTSIFGNASHIAVTGIYSGTITFNGSDSRTSAGNYDGFLSLYDATDGSYENTFTYGTSSDDRMNAVSLIGDDLYIGGYFYSTIDQDLSSTSSNLTSLGSRDGLLLKHSISAPMTDCGLPAPTITGFSNLSHHGTTIQWNSADLPTGGKFVVRYHEFGNSPNFSWKTVPIENANSAYINNLDPNTRYVFRVGTRCGVQTQALYSDTMSVWTKKYCPKPTGLMAAPTATNVTISWDDMGADNYKVRLREVGSGNWRFKNTIGTSATFNNLNPSTQYEWQVRAICSSGGSKSYTGLASFSTPSLRMAMGGQLSAFAIYPNPTSGYINIQFELMLDAQLNMEIKDVSGRVVQQKQFNAESGLNVRNVELAELPMGIYILQLFTEDQQSIVTERIVKR